MEVRIAYKVAVQEVKTMRFMMLVKLPPEVGAEYEAGAMPRAELAERMTRFNEEMVLAGVMLSGEGLHPTAKGARVHGAADRRVVTMGPFAESREVLGGFWIIKVGSLEEAIDWARRMPDETAVIELRQIFDMEDYPADIQAAADSPILREHFGDPQ